MAASAAAARASKPPQQPPPQQQQQQPSSCSSSPEGHVTRGVSGPRSGAPSESARPLRTRLCLPLIERTAPAVELGARRRCHSARLSIFSRGAATHQALRGHTRINHHTHSVESLDSQKLDYTSQGALPAVITSSSYPINHCGKGCPQSASISESRRATTRPSAATWLLHRVVITA